jgi:hypothetical protein
MLGLRQCSAFACGRYRGASTRLARVMMIRRSSTKRHDGDFGWRRRSGASQVNRIERGLRQSNQVVTLGGHRCACRPSYYRSSPSRYSVKTWPHRRNRRSRIPGARYSIRTAGERRDATLTPVSSAWKQSRASAAFASRIYNIALGCSRAHASPGASTGLIHRRRHKEPRPLPRGNAGGRGSRGEVSHPFCNASRSVTVSGRLGTALTADDTPLLWHDCATFLAN